MKLESFYKGNFSGQTLDLFPSRKNRYLISLQDFSTLYVVD